MKPPIVPEHIADDALDALIDLCDEAPTEGDDRIAAWLETRVHAEQTAAAEAQDLDAFRLAQGRTIAAAHYRARVCTALTLTTCSPLAGEEVAA
jgi:hypothetical protein